MRRKLLIASLAAIPLLLTIVVLHLLSGSDEAQPPSAAALARRLEDAGWEAHAHQAPDGRIVAYYLRKDSTPWQDFPDLTHAALSSRPGRLAIEPLANYPAQYTEEGIREGYLFFRGFVVRGHADNLHAVLDLLR